MNPEDEVDPIEITREVWLECEVGDREDEWCHYSGSQVLDGIQHNGMEYFEWTCPDCGSTSDWEGEADLDD